MKNIKTILIISVFSILIILCLIFRYQKNKAIKENAIISVKKEYLQKELNAILADLKNSQEEVIKVSNENDLIRQNLERATKKANEISKKNSLLINQAKKVDNDSSFNFVKTEYKPGVNEPMNYCLSGSQIKQIHIKTLEFNSCIDAKKGLIAQLRECRKLNKGTEREIRLLNKEIKKHKEAFRVQGELLDNSFCENEVLLKDLRRNKFWKNVFKFGLIGAGGYVIVSNL